MGLEPLRNDAPSEQRFMARPDLTPETAGRLKRPLRLTRLGMAAERTTRAFWPLWSVVFAVIAALMLGLHEGLPREAVWGIGALSLLGAGAALWHGVTRFSWPTRDEAFARLDATLPGRPISAVADTQAVGAGDAASEAV